MKKRIFFLFLMTVVFLHGHSAEIGFTASVDAEAIGMEDVLVYTVTFKGIQNPLPPDLSGMDDFNVVQTSRSSEFKFINGESSSFINFVFYLAPMKEGTLVIPPVKYVHENNVLKTQGFRITVVKGSIKKVDPGPRRRSFFDFDEDFSPFATAPAAPEEIDVKLRAVVSKKSGVVGEPFIFRIFLYSRNRVESVNLVSGQSFPGFWQEWYPLKKNIDGKSEIIEGKTYQVYEIRKAVLFPSKAGELKIPGVTFELTLSTGSFDFFSSPRRITRSSNSLKITSYAFEGADEGIPAGKFNLKAFPDSENVNVNDILTVRVAVQGYGNVKIIRCPLFESGEDFRVFPAKESRDIEFRDNGVLGKVTAEIPVAFNREGNIRFEPLELKYFDTAEKKIKTARSEAFFVRVTGVRDKIPGENGRVSGGVAKKGSDISFIRHGKLKDQDSFIYRTVLYRSLIILIFLITLSFPVYAYMIKPLLLGNAELRKRIRVRNIIKKLDNVKEYGEVFQILEEYIEERTGISKSGISKTGIEERFYKAGIGRNETESFLRIRSDSELSRFSPSTIKTVSQVKKETEALKLLLKRIDRKLK